MKINRNIGIRFLGLFIIAAVITGCVINSKVKEWEMVMKENFHSGWENNWVVEGKPELKTGRDGFLGI